MSNHTSYEVRYSTMSSSFPTLEEARKYLDEMWNGFPEKVHMTEENHQYWKRVARKAEIFKVSISSEKIV